MNVREVIYYAVSSIASPMIQWRRVPDLLSLFTFNGSGASLLSPTAWARLKKTGSLAAVAAFVLVFVVNAVWAAVNGRLLSDADPTTYQFFEDWPNLVNYSVLVPLYVALCLCFLLQIGHLRGALTQTGLVEALELDDFRVKTSPLRYTTTALLVLFASVFSISHYASELARYEPAFWFQELAASGDRVLSAHGYYYLLSNWLLNLLVILTIAAHFEMFGAAAELGKGFEQLVRSEKDCPKTLGSRAAVVQTFLPFTSLYIISKALVVVILANMYTWRAQKPEFTGMLEVTILIVALLGVAVVSYPRYHLQYWLFRLWRTRGVEDYPDIRGPFEVGLASLADVLILGGAMGNLVAHVFQTSGVNLRFW